jgi:cell division protease FtsH
MRRKMGSRFVQIALVVVFIVIAAMLYSQMGQLGIETLNYTDLLTRIQQDRVASMNINRDTDAADGAFVPSRDTAGKETTEHFRCNLPPDYSDLLKNAAEHGVKVTFVRPSGLAVLLNPTMLLWIAMLLLPIGLVWFIVSRQSQAGGQSQAFNFGKSRARMMNPERARVTFKDVAGLEEVVDELNEVVDFLKEPAKYQRLGAEIPKGVILLGPPGCGKTLLAKAVAGEANVPFFFISGSDFVEMFVGVGAARVRDLFDQAKRRAPCLVFIDELDAVGRLRGTGIGGGHDEREQTLNQLLVEMDGFEPNSGVIVLAATNRPDVLDPALLRPGRFDRRIVVDSPDAKGREEILKIHLKNKPLGPDVDMRELAQRTPGFSGADLRNVANEAALLTARKRLERVSMEQLAEAIERVVAGPERRSRVISEQEKKVIAYHELGHAVVAYRLPGADPVHKISVLPRGLALGYTLQFPEEDTFLHTRRQLLDRICILMGGRSSEELIFNEVTTGANNDLERATELAREMVTRFGMSDKLGPLTFGNKHHSIFLGKALAEDRNYSEDIASLIDEEVRHIVNECHEKARSILASNRRWMDRVSKTLIEQETLERKGFEQLMNQLDEEFGLPTGDETAKTICQTGTVELGLSGGGA